MAKRTDADYIRLDDAIAALSDWAPEIVEELSRGGNSETTKRAVRSLMEVLDAARRVLRPEE